jgi:soluble lytic murein transglycosylase
VLVRISRSFLFVAVAGLMAGDAYAGPPSGHIPLPQPRPAIKAPGKAGKPAPMSLAPAAANVAAPASIPARGAAAAVGIESLFAPAALGPPTALATPHAVASIPPSHTAPPLAMATTAQTSPVDLATVKQAIELARKGRQDDATDLKQRIADPLARKLVEWVILRTDDNGMDFSRYAAFIAANPSWPSIVMLRRRSEAMLWQQRADAATVLAFFANTPPRSAKGHFALARALLAQGNRAGAQAQVRDGWRNDGFSAELEAQARETFGNLITHADDKIRMDERFYAEDVEAAMRAAHRLGPTELAIAKARAAVIQKSSKAKALLDAVPHSGRHDAGYMFSRIQWLRRADKFEEAAQLMLAAPRDPAHLRDLDQWWIERRLLARKLLDAGNAKTAYAVARGAVPPTKDNYRAEHEFTAGWIALRFLNEPAAALAHFARISHGVSNPITLARAGYWQGRAAEALGRQQEARAHYEAAARFPTAYYGQLARSRLGLSEIALRKPPDPGAGHRQLEVARAMELLYAVGTRDLVAPMAADLADKATDAAALAALAEITTRNHDARATLLIGKIALGRGYALEHYAFPTFGVPDYRQIGPEVERSTVFAIVRQESAFNERVVSSAKALGLMQVMPATGRLVAKKHNVAFDQKRLLNDTVYNAQIGTAELGSVIEDYRGSYILAFASYNAGRGRVRQWLARYGDPRDPEVDPIDWIERIPFSETRNYVQRIMENMQVYRARFGRGSRLLIEADLRRGGQAN